MSLLVVSFLGGILTVFTPCVFLLLPVILAGNIIERKTSNQLLTIISLVFFIFFFTVFLKFSSIFLYVSEGFWTNLSAGLMVFLGLTYLFPMLWSNKYFGQSFVDFGNLLNSFSRNFEAKSYWKPVLTGFALTPIFASCSPVYFLLLATVLPANLGLGILYLAAYCLGIGLVLFIIGNIGQNFLLKVNRKIVENMHVKIGIGVLFLFVGVLIFTGLDKKLETNLSTPEVVKNADRIILANPVPQTEKKQIIPDSPKRKTLVDEKIDFKNLGVAPELVGISGYINVEPGTGLYDLLQKNKVVLFEFWTYSCINCKRTIPYLNSWYEKYHDKGFEIVGVHTPEFAFEKVRDNVVQNSQKQGVKFPVFMDNDYSTWNAYNNQYWPMRFLILPSGQIIYQHAGEGDYEYNENLIEYIVDYK